MAIAWHIPFVCFFSIMLTLAAEACLADSKGLPAELKAIWKKPLYRNATFGLQVEDLDTGEVVYSVNGDQKLMIGSLRKLFSIGLALNKLGTDHRFLTPIYRRGEVVDGVLRGDLILVASGDLSMGGRSGPNGTIEISSLDHNEANSLGTALLTDADPLAGYQDLARQVAAAGIRQVTGDVIIDDRLFQPFNFRDEFDVRPIFVNDDVVDVMISPSATGETAKVDWRPKSKGLTISSQVTTSGAKTELRLEFDPLADCIGKQACETALKGEIPIDFRPPFTDQLPLVRTVRIVEPQNYARTVLIEALTKAGVEVAAPAVAQNAADRLPAKDSYHETEKVAARTSAEYAEYAHWILKVSYNIGADTSLLLLGLRHDVDTMADALKVEANLLKSQYKIPLDQFHFIDGSGGGATQATPQAIVSMLQAQSKQTSFSAYHRALPRLAVDGSLASVNQFLQDPRLAGAKGKVYGKTGTYLLGNDQGTLDVKGQGLAGYVETKSGRRLAYATIVNNVDGLTGLEQFVEVMQDQGTIAAILWNDQ